MCVKYFATLTPLRTEKTFDANPNVLYSEGNVISLILPKLFLLPMPILKLIEFTL